MSLLLLFCLIWYFKTASSSLVLHHFTLYDKHVNLFYNLVTAPCLAVSHPTPFSP